MPLFASQSLLQCVLESIVPSVIAELISAYHDEMIPITILRLRPHHVFVGKIDDNVYTSYDGKYECRLYKNNVQTVVRLNGDRDYRIMRVKQHILLIASQTRCHVWNISTNRVVDLETGQQARACNGYVYYINSGRMLYQYNMDTNHYLAQSETDVYAMNVIGPYMSYTCDCNRPCITRKRITYLGKSLIIGECMIYGQDPCLTIWKDSFSYKGKRYHLKEKILDVGLFDDVLLLYCETAAYTWNFKEDTLTRMARPNSLLRICNDTHMYSVEDDKVYVY